MPTWMGLENYQACRAPKRILIVDGAEHAMSYLVDTKRYQEAVIEFLEGDEILPAIGALGDVEKESPSYDFSQLK